MFLLPFVSLALGAVSGIQEDLVFASGCVRTPPVRDGAISGPCLHLFMLASKARTLGRSAQEGLTPLTSPLLLHTGQWPCPVLGVHSALVQDPVHSQDVHLRLLDGPGPK